MSQGSWGAMPKGAGGFSSLYKDSRKKVTASSENYRCQKCLEVGHFTYECKGERKYVAKTSRTVMLKRRIEGDTRGGAKHGKQKKVEESSSSGKFLDSGIYKLLTITFSLQTPARQLHHCVSLPNNRAWSKIVMKGHFYNREMSVH